jgi:hypothetical protein
MKTSIISFVVLMLLITSGVVLAQSQDKSKKDDQGTNAAKSEKVQSIATTAISDDLKGLFAVLDDLGRAAIKDAKPVELTLVNSELPDRKQTKLAWLVSEDDKSVTVLEDDLIPWTYSKHDPTTIPASWNPAIVKLDSVHEADAEARFKQLSKKDDNSTERKIFAPGPSYRALAAHAAWKKGLTQYCNTIIAPDVEGKGFQEYRQAVLDDLAWLHYLRGVNLLMYADRGEVVKHLRLVSKISPKSEFADKSKDLADRLDKVIAEKAGKPAKQLDESKLNDEERANLYVSQLVDLHCFQFAQPGEIEPYLAVVNGMPDQNPSTAKLRQLQMTAVPVLLKALEDETPTRTVYHWRDFAHNRVVWRVSDFAWNILRDITKKDLGNQAVVGFTFSSMMPEQKRQAIAEANQWYAANKSLSADDRMLAFFSSHNPEDWKTAAEYFLQKKDKRAVAPILKKIPEAGQFGAGKLCELVAGFGDQSAIPVLQKVLKTAPEASDRMSAAIALWDLGDESGVPAAIEYAKADKQPYGDWEELIWFLMRSKHPNGIKALSQIINTAPTQRVAEVIETIAESISGNLSGERRQPAGCVEVLPMLITAMDRNEYTGATVNDVKVRINDSAARAMVLLREGASDSPGRFASVDPKMFDQVEPDEKKRDEQIDALKKWYEENKDRLVWDAQNQKLGVVKGKN